MEENIVNFNLEELDNKTIKVTVVKETDITTVIGRDIENGQIYILNESLVKHI